MLFLAEGETYFHTNAAYQEFVDNFGPDDFNSMKQLAYFNVSRLKLKELIALYRLGAYDSTIFIKLLPRLKQVLQTITFNERIRIAQTIEGVWDMYFNINESFDLAYEMGGMLYDLGYYSEALNYFQYSEDSHGEKADTYYNQALCYYQLRQDELFFKTLNEAKNLFPDFERFEHLENLDMG
jgi:tetratricopeptide (TPR) repeat protein